jgi:hypothetical protein
MSIEHGIPKYAALLHFALELNSTAMIVIVMVIAEKAPIYPEATRDP